MSKKPLIFSDDHEVQKYIKFKGDITREEIKVFIGEYLSKCKEYKYDILESLMKGIVFDEKYIRESYIQEILLSL